jgi:hypothetical protein
MVMVAVKRKVRTHRDLRTLRSVHTHTGPGRGEWLRLQESELLAALAVRRRRKQITRPVHLKVAGRRLVKAPAKEGVEQDGGQEQAQKD